MTDVRKNLGQYFTTDDSLCKYISDIVTVKSPVLEPSFGIGHLVSIVLEKNKDIEMDCIEIDEKCKDSIIFTRRQNCNIIYDDFLTLDFKDKLFNTIIANPPYVKMRGKNLYIRFVERCFELLKQNGEMIFIVPSDFIKVTGSKNIIKMMDENGIFTHFFFPDRENLFIGASIDVLVFRYIKTIISENLKRVSITRKDTTLECSYRVQNGIITFLDDLQANTSIYSIDSIFDVYVGMVSGKDSVFKIDFDLSSKIDRQCKRKHIEPPIIKMLKDKDIYEDFIFVDNFPTGIRCIDERLLENKKDLINRRIRKFTEKDWYRWGAERNIKTIKAGMDKDCIYVKTITRSSIVAFVGTVGFFGGSLLCMIPKKNTDLDKLVDYLNTDIFKIDYTYSGRFKIGQRQLCNVMLSL